MPDGQQPDHLIVPQRVSKVALAALAQVVAAGPKMRPPLESFLSQMFEATCAPDRQALTDVVQMMLKSRVSAAQIAEEYVPIIARRLGDAWVADRIGFGGTSIGSARLQGLLWELKPEWGACEDLLSTDRPAYLIGVPRGAQHTLGATVLAGHLRQRGISVCLNLDLTPDAVRQEMQNRDFHGILLSAHGIQHLEVLGEMVVQCKHASRSTPVIVGGHILEHSQDIQACTKADIVTSDPHKAVSFCEMMRSANQNRTSSRATK